MSLFLILLINCSEDKISLTGTGTLTGKVVAVEDFLPLENVKISTNPTSSTVFTNALGEFEIQDLIVNDYSVQAEKDGYLTQFEGISITDNSVVNLIFEMDVETANNKPPVAPVLDSPADNATDLETEVQLIWSGSDPDGDEINYSIEILNDLNSEILEFSNISDTTYTVSGLKYGTKYFWQVSATDEINEPSLSDVYSFETLPFPNNRFFFVRNINGNNVIYSGDDEGNEIQLTSENSNSWRPRKATNINKIAFLKSNGGQTHLYTMNLDGSDVTQVSSAVPVAGFNLDEIDFSWGSNDSFLYYPSFDKLYRISPDGSNLSQIHQTSNGNFISEVDWNQQTSKLALKTNDNSGYNVTIYTVNLSGVLQETVLDGVNGAAGGLDFSFDGSQLLYTYDISENENIQYRILDSNMFIYDFNTLTSENVSDGKSGGSNDLDPKFSPNGAQLIFVNTSNDGISQKNVLTVNINQQESREVIYSDAFMPDWK
ncbi:MAG: hypothetical protein HKO81_05960 [Flavobacteriaceae bacterium]|nr:hypothetical protein [Flavobacteriaceae bacterium]